MQNREEDSIRGKLKKVYFEELQQNAGDSKYALFMGLSSFAVIQHFINRCKKIMFKNFNCLILSSWNPIFPLKYHFE